MEAWVVTEDAIADVLDAACDAARRALEYVHGGPVVGSQEGDDPNTFELILAEGHIYRVHVEFEAL